jgi:hypothetical protein
MRIQTDVGNIIILVMPQTAEPIPTIPDWLSKYATGYQLVAKA